MAEYANHHVLFLSCGHGQPPLTTTTAGLELPALSSLEQLRKRAISLCSMIAVLCRLLTLVLRSEMGDEVSHNQQSRGPDALDDQLGCTASPLSLEIGRLRRESLWGGSDCLENCWAQSADKTKLIQSKRSEIDKGEGILYHHGPRYYNFSHLSLLGP